MYTQFYNFSEKPFNLTPDPKFLYLTPSHREALASMVYGINERKGFIAITGEVGVGKTTLVYTLLNNLNEKVKTAFVYHTSATFEQLLSYILMDLNVTIDSNDKITLLGKLNEYLTHNITQDETLAIIIDEAQNLPNKLMEEFRLLSNLETSKQKLLQILLVGQPELEAKLNSQDLRQLKQRISIRRKIKPLTPKEREEYIDHRLKIVGSNSKSVFNSDAISVISKYSEGIPRIINIVCDNALLIGYSHSKKKITRKIVEEVLEDLSDSIETIPDTPTTATSPVMHAEKTFSKKALGIFFCSVVILIALVFFALYTRQDSNKILSQKNVVKLTQTAPEQASTSTALQPEIKEKTQQMKLQQETIQEKPFSKQILAKPRAAKTSLIKEGGSLYSIGLNHYQKANPTIYDLILKANPDITDIRKIPDNQEILLPNITGDSFITEVSDDSYRIYIGTFLTKALANACSDKLSQWGKKARIEALKFSASDTWYQVTIDNFSNKQEALETVYFLIDKNIIPFP